MCVLSTPHSFAFAETRRPLGSEDPAAALRWRCLWACPKAGTSTGRPILEVSIYLITGTWALSGAAERHLNTDGTKLYYVEANNQLRHQFLAAEI